MFAKALPSGMFTVQTDCDPNAYSLSVNTGPVTNDQWILLMDRRVFKLRPHIGKWYFNNCRQMTS